MYQAFFMEENLLPSIIIFLRLFFYGLDHGIF
ncbi:hypothetical protein AEQU2_00178 [Aequorivita lipolytica]|nr:hypothetical protein AEQU2_00178 [Aequorivita lipolytica]